MEYYDIKYLIVTNYLNITYYSFIKVTPIQIIGIK